MQSESHLRDLSGYPRKPWLAAVLAFFLGPIGFLYTSSLLFILSSIISLLLVVTAPDSTLNVFDWRVQIFGRLVCAVVAWAYAFSARNLNRFPLFTRFDQPGWLKSIFLAAVTLTLIYLFTQTIMTAVGWRGASMLPTIRTGERVRTTVLPILQGEIVRGTIVRFTEPEGGRTLISRVVALQGDTVELKRGLVYVNGKATDDPAMISLLRASGCIDEELDSNNAATLGNNSLQAKRLLRITVPNNQIFLVSDNRAVPVMDSRYFGPISLSKISGVTHPNTHVNQHLSFEDCHPSYYDR